MTILEQGRRAAAFLLSEANALRSRENGVLAASQTIEPGQVLGATAGATGVDVSVAADAGNTASSGALTLASPAYTGAVKNGAYRVTCIEPGTDAGTFRVEDPLGAEIGIAKVGVAFTKQIKFTIADATDFVAGDAFTVSVALEPTDRALKAWDPTATDGSEIVAGISLYPAVTAVSETLPISYVARDAEANHHELVWPVSASAAVIAKGTAQLADLGIIAR